MLQYCSTSDIVLWYNCTVYCTSSITIETSHRASTSTHDISCLALHYHSNENRARIANPPNTAQLEGTPYHSPKLHPGPCSSVGMQRGTDRQADTWPWPIYISPRIRLTRNVISHCPVSPQEGRWLHILAMYHRHGNTPLWGTRTEQCGIIVISALKRLN